MNPVTNLKLPFGSFRVEWKKKQYATGPLAIVGIIQETGEPLCKLSFYLKGESENLKEGEFLVKTWSENEPVIAQLKYEMDTKNQPNELPFSPVGMTDGGEIIWKTNF